jgi:hypothetical protein
MSVGFARPEFAAARLLCVQFSQPRLLLVIFVYAHLVAASQQSSSNSGRSFAGAWSCCCDARTMQAASVVSQYFRNLQIKLDFTGHCKAAIPHHVVDAGKALATVLERRESGPETTQQRIGEYLPRRARKASTRNRHKYGRKNQPRGCAPPPSPHSITPPPRLIGSVDCGGGVSPPRPVL